jgi:hypothetical protein
MNIYKSILLLALSVFLSPSAAGVENVTYCDLQTVDGPTFAVDHTLPLFDPTLGDLVGVDLTVELELVQNYSFENTASDPQTVDLNTSVELVVTPPDSGSISVGASVLIREDLAEFDGEEDFAGPSGKILMLTNSSSKTIEYPDLSDFVALVPGEMISFPAEVTHPGGGTPVPGNLISVAQGSVRSEVCVTYRYESAVTGEGGI